MIKKILSLSFSFFILSGSFCVGWAADKLPNVRGAFYPAEKDELAEMVDGFLEKAEQPSIKGEIVALVSPHAGYIYSGQVAAYGYKALKYKSFDTVIIIGPSHQLLFDGFSVYPEGSFFTPLGKVEVDEDLAKKIMSKSKKISFEPEVFKKEYSIEAQLPFLQRAFQSFKIVPIIAGNLDYENCRILSDAIVSSLDKEKKVLIVASTDLSHFHSYAEAKEMDMKAIETVKNMQPEVFFDKIKSGQIEMCGAEAVVTTMLIAKQLGGEDAELLRYANSGDVTFDKTRVVGYAAMIFLKTDKNRGEENMLNEKQRKKILEIARDSIGFYMKNKKLSEFTVEDEVLKQKKGAFVTLTINGQLRGCIGRLVADTPLYKVVNEMAVEAAFDDGRFSPLSASEFEKVKVEISVLSLFKKIESLDEIEVGSHGLLIRKGFNSGLLLPQVATDYGWNRQEFLENVCYKAGLDKDAYKKGAEIHIFSAEVFGEE